MPVPSRFRVRCLAFALLLAFACPWPSIRPAEAVSDRFQAFDIWPRVGERHFFSLNSSQTLYQYQYAFHLSNVFVWRPLDLLDPAGLRIRSVVGDYFGHFISGGVGLKDFWQVDFTLPLFSRIRFEDPLLDPSPGSSSHFRLGDLRIASKVRVVDANRHRFGLAFEPFVTIPLGADDVYMGNASVTGGLNAIGDVIISRRVRLALNLGVEFHGERVVINNINFSHRYLSSLGVSVDAGKGIRASAEMHANTAFSDFFADRDTIPIEFLGGVQWDIGDSGFTLGAGGGSCAICGARGAKARGFLNLGYRRLNESYLLKEKQDLDMMVVTLGGQPDQALAYEIYDLVDKCPIDKSQFVTDRDDPKCMEIYELQDLQCPSEDQFKRGRDNIKCLTVYELRKRDTDKDGVADYIDWCPTQYGGGKDRGCPDKAYLIINPETGQILTRSIHFEFGKATLMQESIVILDTLTGAIHSQPGIKHLSIEGHTDDIGSDGANQSLSYARARTVYQYLVDHGINPARLSYKGFGERYPLTGNDTAEGRARNRRVDFIIQRVEGPTAAPWGVEN